MYKYLPFLAVFIVVLANTQISSAQTKPDQTRVRESTFTGSSGSSRKIAGEMDRPVSAHSLALAYECYQMGVKYNRAGLFRQAAESFEKALQYHPGYPDAHYGLGDTYLTLGRLPEAIKHLELALKLNPNHAEAYTKLGAAHFKSGNPMKLPNQGSNDAVGLEVSLNASTGPAPSSAKFKEDLTNIYRVGVGDILDVRLSDTTASTLFTVTNGGLLEHPNLVEPLPVAGLTVEEIKAKLEDDLKRRAISEQPKVAVTVREYQSHGILVSGMVKEPGTKLLRREAIPLYVVIADAQPLAEAGRLTLIQHETRRVFNIDLSEPAQMNILVRPGDVITVHRNPTQFFYLGGEVKSPGEKAFRPGLTLTQAILVAEGLTKKGKEAQLAREKSDGFLQVTRYKLKDINSGKVEDPLIQPGDRITIVD